MTAKISKWTHNLFTKKDTKIVLNADYYKRVLTIDGVFPYPKEEGAGKLCKTELIEYVKTKELNIRYNAKIINSDDVTG